MTTKRRDQLIEQHGPVLAAIIHNAETAEREKRAAKYQELRTELAQVQDAISMKREAAARRRQGLENEMNAAYGEYLAATARFEAAKQADQSALADLLERQHAIVREITADPNQNRIEQWRKVNGMPQLASA